MNAVFIGSLFFLLVMMRVDPKKIGWYAILALAGVGAWYLASAYQILIIPR